MPIMRYGGLSTDSFPTLENVYYINNINKRETCYLEKVLPTVILLLIVQV